MVVSLRTDAEAPVIKEEIPHDHLFRVTGLSSNNLEKHDQKAADFETAIAATGCGRFNVLLMLCTLPAFWSAVSVTSSVTYIFTRAHCDLNLSMVDMGTINGITYAGMMTSALIWGFLSDTLGRRHIMSLGFLCSGLVELAAATSQTFFMLLVTRFASGFLFNGPCAVLISYLAEVHRTELRARVLLLTSLFYTVANVTLPLLAWAVLTQDWHFRLHKHIVFHNWNIFLLITALVPLLTGAAFLSLPESPKFLMSRGRNQEALDIFKRIYSMNTGNPPEHYPVTCLVEEKSVAQGRGLTALRGGLAQLLPLFRPPHIKWLLLVCIIHMGCMFGSNTIRLWYPQLAAMLAGGGGLCAALAPVEVTEEPCTPLAAGLDTYLHSSIVGAGSLLTYSLGGMFINRCGKKTVVGVCGACSGIVALTMPLLARGAVAAAAAAATALAFTALFGAALSTVAVDLFPTPLRVMAMATFLMSGRFGTIAGAVTFPALVVYGCMPPFITIGTVLAACGLACYLLPNTTLKKLE
ncbi:hypothetical protein ACJJTC_003620 [Scirpophaga incertulas]